MANPGPAPSHMPEKALAAQPGRVLPRIGKMKPLTQAIQLAMFRIDKGDTQPRIVKLGELIARKAMAGEEFFVKIVADRLDGLATPLDDKGEPVDLHGATVRQLVELLHERRGKVVDVVAEMVDNKPKE